MKISFECDVESKTKLSSDLMLEYRDRQYIFSLNEMGYIAKIKIIASPRRPELYSSRTEPRSDHPTGRDIIINTDKEFDDEIEGEFQFLEGMLALYGNLTRIKWQSILREYIPETDEEVERTRGLPLSFERLPRDVEKTLGDEQLAQLVMAGNRYKLLSVPLALYREGFNEIRSFRFINAFYNFFFILEAIFTSGNTNKIAVKRDNEVI